MSEVKESPSDLYNCFNIEILENGVSVYENQYKDFEL